MQDNQSNSNFPNGVNPNQPGVNQPPNAGGGSFAPNQGVSNMPRPNVPPQGAPGQMGVNPNQGMPRPPMPGQQPGVPGQGYSMPNGQPNMPNQSVNNVNPSFNPANNQGAPGQMGVNPNQGMPRPQMPGQQPGMPGQGYSMPNGQQNFNGQPAGQNNSQGGASGQGPQQQKEKGKKRKKAIMLVITFLIAAIGGIFAAMSLLSSKTYSINFETGPFATLDKATVQGGETYDVPNDLNDIIGGNGNTLVEFTGWFTDADRTIPYTSTKVNSDLTLYAGYKTYPVKVTFVSPNYMSDNGYVYLTSISPKYYEGTVDFDSQELLDAIYNLNTDIYTQGSGDNVYSYNPGNGNLGSISIETADYVNYIDNYYNIIGFSDEPNGEIIYNFSDEIETPSEESVYYVIFQPNEVEINFNSNLSGLNSYYESLGGADYSGDNFTDQNAPLNKFFKDQYTLLNYISYNALGLTNPNPAYHKFLGWSAIAPDAEGFGEEGNYYPVNATITLDHVTLNNQTEVTLYAVWQVIDTGLVINTSYDKDDNIYGSVRDSISMGESKGIQEIISTLNLEKEGYALVGFNSKADGTGEIVSIEGELVGNRSSSYYDKESDSLILYAVYKKIVDNTYILLNDDDLDVVDYASFVSDFEFNLNLSSYTNPQGATISYYYDESEIEVSYDATKDAVNIKNLIEGASFVLPSLVRSNYNLEKYIINEKDYQKETAYVLNVNDFDLSGDANINISPVWKGVDYALKFYPVYPNAENITEEFTPVILSYGSQVYMIYTQSQEDDYTVVSTYLCNAANSTPISGSSFTIRLRGHSFSGWNQAELVEENDSQNLVVSDNKVQNQTPFVVNSQFNSVAAKWLVNLYDVTYYLNGGTYDGSTDVQVIEDVPFGSTITLIAEDALTREDYWFEGWSLKSSGQNQTVDYSYDGEEIVVEKDIQLYAVWAQKYYINLYADVTRETSARITVDRDNTYDLSGSEISGFTFEKFNTTTLGDGTEYVTGANLVYELEENLNLYAMWFDVSFADGNDNNYGVTGTNPDSFAVTYGASFTLPTNPYTCYPYYKFNNWNYGSSIGLDFFTANEEVTSFAMAQENIGKDIEFVANWLYKNIKLNVYTNQNKTKLHYSKIVDVNKYEVETLYQANAQFPSIENKEIDYFTDGQTAFFTVADANGNKVEISIPKPAEGMTFDSGSDAYIYNIYPMWKLTVQYLGNNRSSDQEIKYISAVYSDANSNNKIELSEISTEYTFSLIANPFVYENRSFVGWATTNNATEGVAANTEVTLTRDVVYYAIWEFKNFVIKFVDTKNTFTDGTFMYNDVKTLVDCGFPEDLTGYTINDYDSTDGCYKNFVGFAYNNGEERLFIKVTDELTFASLDDGGFIANNEFATDNTIELTAVWEEQIYTVTVDLLGGTLQDLSLLNGKDVQYIYDNNTNSYKLQYNVKYSEVKSSSDGLSLIYDGLSKNKYRFNGFAPTDTSVSMVIAPGAASGEYIYKYASDAQSFNATAGDVINVVWQEVYSLAFNSNGANGQIDGQSADAVGGTSTFTIPADTNAIVYPYAGVTFVGWWFTNDVNDIKQNLASLYNWNSSVVVDSNVMNKYGVENIVTLYAVWQTTVTFQTELQGVSVTGYHTPAGDVETGLTYFTDTFYCGDNVTADVLLSYYFTISSDGYQFSGWQYNGQLVNEITITQPITLTASWGNSYISIYLKDYDGNDFTNEDGDLTPVEIEILYDPSVSIDLNNYYKEESGSSSLPARFGYEFIGWKVGLTNTVVSASKVGELTIYNATNKFALPNSSTTLYAVYKIAQVRVVYDINNADATNNEGEANKIVEGLEYNTAYKVAGADYSLEYHSIVAWTYVDKAGNTLESEVGESVSLLEEYGVVKSASGDYILTFFAKWERVVNTVQINLGTGLFDNNGTDEENPIEEFYGVDDYIKSYTYDVDKIILEVYQGSQDEGYGFKVPGTEYVYHTELFEVVYYADRNGNTYHFDTLYSVTEDITLNAEWARLVEIHVYKNLGESKEEIVLRAQLNSNLDLSIKNNSPHINETAITFVDENYNLISYNTNAEGTGRGYSIESGFVVLNATNFTIKSTYKMDLYCQWQGDPITITIDYNDISEEEDQTKVILQNDTLKYGVEFDLTDYIPTTRADGNQGYEFASFEDEFSNIYTGENLIFKTGLLEFQENYLLSVNWKAKQFVLTYELPSALYNGDMTEFMDSVNSEGGVTGGSQDEAAATETGSEETETEVEVDRSKFSKLVEYGSTVTLIDSTLIVNTTNNEEFPILVFDGYQSSVSINNSTKVTANFTMPASDVMLTGLWKSRNFMLVIDAGESSFEEGGNTKTLTGYDFTQVINLPLEEAPIRDGYTLQYKYDYYYTAEAEAFTKTKLLAPDAEFNFGAYNDSSNIDEEEGNVDNSLAGDLEFIWNEELESFVINLTAVWTPIQYVVVFDKNLPDTQNGYAVNASGSVNGVISDMIFTYDQAQDISTRRYTLTGWTLTGWNTQADGQGSTILLAPTGETLVNNLTTVGGTSVTLYAMWQQNEYTLQFEDLSGENTGDNAIENQTILFDNTFVLDDLIFASNPLIALTFDSTEGVYKEFIGWRYVYDGSLSDRIYTNDQEILFALASNSGFIGNVEDLTDSIVTLRAEWQEVSYNLVLDLKGATYSNTRNEFEYTFNSDTRTFNIIIPVKYSDLSNGTGIDLTAEGIGFDSSKIAYDYAFAGWSKDSSVNSLHFADGENIKFEGLTQAQLDPTQENIFKVYAMFDIYKITINSNGGEVIEDKVSEITSQKWSVSEDRTYITLYTHKNSSVTLPANLGTWFERENYHIDASNSIAGKQLVNISEDKTENIIWSGNFRYVILDTIEEGATIDYSRFTGATVTEGGYRWVTDVTESNYSSYYVYTYNKESNTGSFSKATSYDANVKYFTQVPAGNAITIATYYSKVVDTLNLVLAEGDETFKGWVDRSGNQNYSLRPLTVGGGDSEVIQLFAAWKDIYLFVELNGGTYKVLEDGTYVDKTEIERISGTADDSDAGIYHFNIPAKVTATLSPLGPNKTGYTFLGWSDTYSNYDKYVAAGRPSSSLINNNNQNSVTYTISDGYSKTLYAIWQPYTITVEFKSATIEEENYNHGTPFTATYNYGETITLPNIETDARMSNWGYTNYLFVGWYNEVTDKDYDQDSSFILNTSNDLPLNSEGAVRTSVVIFSRWQPTDVDVKIFLNGGEYIGNESEYLSSTGTDDTYGEFILIENQTFNEAFELIDFEDLYKFGYYTNSYYNLVRGNSITDTVITLSSDILNGYELLVRVEWNEATSYIKDYYDTNFHKFYDTFENAVDAASSGHEVVLLTERVLLSNTITVDKNLIISIDADMKKDATIIRNNTFNLNSGDTRNFMFDVKEGKTLTFAENTYGTLTINGSFDADCGVAINVLGGSLVLNSGVIIRENTNTNTVYGGAIYGQDATIIINGAIITANQVNNSNGNSYGGAISLSNSSITINGGEISSNTSVCDNGNASAGAIYAVNSAVDIFGCTFINNSAVANTEDKTSYGGALFISANSVLNIAKQEGENSEDIIFSNNTADNGGAIYFDTTGLIASTIDGVDFSNNNLAGEAINGGAININNGLINIANVSLTNNWANNGGAIYIFAGTLNLSNAEIVSNTATNNGLGGALYVGNKAKVVVDNCILGTEEENLEGNTAGNGGAIYSQGDLTIELSTIAKNKATAEGSFGGGIYAVGTEEAVSKLNILGCLITLNTAEAKGAGIYIGERVVYTIDSHEEIIEDDEVVETNNEITFNTADKGAGLYVATDELNTYIANVRFAYNVALIEEDEETDETTFKGGAVYAERGVVSFTENVLIEENQAYSGAGIYIETATVNLTDVSSSEYVVVTEGPEADIRYYSNHATYGGFIYNSVAGTVIYNSGKIRFNDAQYGSAIYNLGTAKIGELIVEYNKEDGHSQIYTSGNLEIFADTEIQTDQRIYIERNGVNSYKYITVSKTNYQNTNSADNGVYIAVDSYIIDAIIVKFTTKDAYDAYKAEFDANDGNNYFKIINIEEYKISTNDEQLALVINYQKYDVIFNDISGDRNAYIQVETVEVDYGYKFTQDFINQFTADNVKPTRAGYDFVGWAYYTDGNGKVGAATTDAQNGYANATNLVNTVSIANYNFNLYAIWKPYEFEVRYQYDNAYESFGKTSYSINGVDINNTNLAVFTDTVTYGETYSFITLDELYAVEFVSYLEYVSMAKDETTGNITLTLDGGKTVQALQSNGYAFTYDSTEYLFDGVDKFYTVFNKDYNLVNEAGNNAYLYPQKIEINGEEDAIDVMLTADGRYCFTYNEITYVYKQYYRPDFYKFSQYEVSDGIYGSGDQFDINVANPLFVYEIEEGTNKKVINVKICFERMASTVIVNANGGEGGFEYNCYSGETFVMPSYSKPVTYNNVEQFVFRKDYALRGFSTSLDGEIITLEEIVVPETATAMYILYAIWDEAVCFVDNAVEKREVYYDVYYSSIEEAVEDINNNLVDGIYSSVQLNEYFLYITEDTSINSSIVLTEKTTIRVYSGSVKVTAGEDLPLTESALEIASGVEVTIGSEETTSATITFESANEDRTDSFLVIKGTAKLLNGVRFENCKSNYATVGGAITVESTAIVEISGVTFIGNEAINGGAIYSSGILVINDATFGEETAINTATNGGAIYVAGATTTINKAIFTYNTAANGGAIYVDSAANLTLKDVKFVNNTATTNGGAIYAKNGITVGEASVATVEFNYNTANDGGAIYAENSAREIAVISAKFVSNTATNSGGAIYANNSALNISGAQFVSNIASLSNGGAIYTNAKLTVNSTNAGDEKTLFNLNKAIAGGAVYVQGTNPEAKTIINIADVELTSNQASDGGAVYAKCADVRIDSNTQFKNNGTQTGFTTYNGGAIYADQDAVITVAGLIESNNAINGAGIYATSNAKILLNSATITGNKASTNGGGLFLFGESYLVITGSTNRTQIIENEASSGGGIYFASSSLLNDLSVGTISNNKANVSTTSCGGGIYVMTGNLVVNGTTVIGNVANSKGDGVYISNDAKFTLTAGYVKEAENEETAGVDIYVSALNNESFGSFEIGSNALVKDVFLAGSTLIRVISDLTSDFTNEANIIDIVLDKTSEGKKLVEFNSEDVVVKAPFAISEEVGRAYYIEKDGKYLILAKLASSVTINPNQGVVSHNETDYSSLFTIDISGLTGQPFAVLSGLTGYKFGYELSGSFTGDDGLTYTAESLIPKYPVVLSVIWDVIEIEAKKVVEGNESDLDDFNINKAVYVDTASKTYHDFAGWEVAYKVGENFVMTGLIVPEHTTFKLKELDSENAISGSTYSYISVYEGIIENDRTIYFVAKFTRTEVKIIIQGCEGLTAEGNPAYEVVVYQDEEEFNLANCVNVFTRTGYILTGFFMSEDDQYNETIDRLYALDEKVEIKTVKEVTLYCYWEYAEAYIKAGNLSENNQYFLTLSEALAATVDNDTLVIVNDVEIKSTYTISNKITVIAYTDVDLTRAASFINGYMFNIEAEVVFGDTSTNELRISGGNVNSASPAIYVAAFKQLTLNKSVILKNNENVDGNGAGVYAAGTVIINGATITSNTAKNGAGVYVTGNVQIISGSIESNTAENGGGIYVGGSATITMTLGNITKNIA